MLLIGFKNSFTVGLSSKLATRFVSYFPPTTNITSSGHQVGMFLPAQATHIVRAPGRHVPPGSGHPHRMGTMFLPAQATHIIQAPGKHVPPSPGHPQCTGTESACSYRPRPPTSYGHRAGMFLPAQATHIVRAPGGHVPPGPSHPHRTGTGRACSSRPRPPTMYAVCRQLAAIQRTRWPAKVGWLVRHSNDLVI